MRMRSFFVVGFLGVASVMGGAASARDNSSLLDPTKIESKVEATSSLLAKVLLENSGIDQYQGVVGFIQHYGEWITLKTATGTSPRIHITSYLLQTGNESLASTLLKNGVVDGWISYRFMDAVSNDFLFALEGEHVEYLATLFQEKPNGINSEIPIRLDGSNVLPIAVLATNEHKEKPRYKQILTGMLDAGANPYQKMGTGLSSLMIASSSNNMVFVRIVQDHFANESGSLKSLLKNTPLDSGERIEMQAIADTLIEQTAEKKSKYNYAKLHDMWIQMILKGYNVPADIIYEELKKRGEFDVDYVSENGLNAMMAAVMSPLYGGNVEYANLLIDRGALPGYLIETYTEEGTPLKIGYIQLALQKDNYKIVALLISTGINFVTVPDDQDTFLLSEALEQKAYLSATILRQALVSVLKNKTEEE
jgi:ankyrin repeat protein